MVRIMLGHGRFTTRNPPAFAGTGLPCLSTTSATMPCGGLVAFPCLVGIARGSGGIATAPVSVCPPVSTVGQRPAPMTLWYHIHASGLIGSPRLPSSVGEPINPEAWMWDHNDA